MRRHLTNPTHGRDTSMKSDCWIDTQTSPMTSNLALMRASDLSPKHTPLQTDPLSLNTKLNSTGSFRLNLRANATSVQSLTMKQNSCLAHFKHPRSVSFQSRESRENSASSKTYLFPTHQHKPSLPSTAPLTPISIHAHGARSQSFASSLHASHPALKQQCGMSKKHTEPFPSSLSNGQESLYDCRRTALQLILEIVSAWLQGVVSMASLVMPEPRSCALVEWDPCQSGWTTIYSSASSESTSRSTTFDERSGPKTSLKMEAKSTMVAGSGLRAKPCQTTNPKSLTKTHLSQSGISPMHPKGTVYIPLLLQGTLLKYT